MMDGNDKHTAAMLAAFPVLDPGIKPLGARVVVQLKLALSKSASGIILAEEARQNEEANTAVARVHEIGPLAFKKRDTMEPWPEGIWAQPGDFVRVPRWGGDRITIEHKGEKVTFVILNDHELIAKVTGDPLSMRGYV